MEHLSMWMQYLLDHPSAALWVLVAGAALYWLLNRRSRLQREADKRLEEIRAERGDPYNKMRPLR